MSTSLSRTGRTAGKLPNWNPKPTGYFERSAYRAFRGMILHGNSYAARNGTAGTTHNQTGSGVWAAALSGGSLRVNFVSSVGGENSAEGLARLKADALSKNGDFVVLYGPLNDLSTTKNLPPEQTLLNTTKSWEQVLESGKTPVQLLIPPIDVVGGSLTTFAARVGEIPTINEKIIEIARRYPRVRIAYNYTALLDPATGLPRAGYMVDGLHTSALGAHAEALSILAAVQDMLPQRENYGLVSDAADSRVVTPSSQQLITNPLFAGNTGTKTLLSGSVLRGDIPSDFTANNLAGATLNLDTEFVRSPSGIGRGLRIWGTAGTTSAQLAIISNQLQGMLAAGDTLEMAWGIEYNEPPVNVHVSPRQRRSINAADANAEAFIGSAPAAAVPAGTVIAPRIAAVIPSGTLTIITSQLVLQFVGGAASFIDVTVWCPTAYRTPA